MNTDHNTDNLDHRDADRLPELDLEQHEVEWGQLPDGADALFVDGGGIDGGKGSYVVTHGDDLHVYGSLDPVVPGHVGCIVIAPDGTRRVAQVMPDPLAGQQPD